MKILECLFPASRFNQPLLNLPFCNLLVCKNSMIYTASTPMSFQDLSNVLCYDPSTHVDIIESFEVDQNKDDESWESLCDFCLLSLLVERKVNFEL